MVKNNTAPKLVHDGKTKLFLRYTWPVNRPDKSPELQERIHIALSPTASMEHILDITRPFFLQSIGTSKKPTETQVPTSMKKSLESKVQAKTLQRPLKPTPNLPIPLKPTPAPSVIRSPSQAKEIAPQIQPNTLLRMDQVINKMHQDSHAGQGGVGSESDLDALKQKLLRGFTTDGSPPAQNDRSSETARPTEHTPRLMGEQTPTTYRESAIPSPIKTPHTNTTRATSGSEIHCHTTSSGLSHDMRNDRTQMESLIQMSPRMTDEMTNSTSGASDLIGLDISDEAGEGIGLLDKFPPLTQRGVSQNERMEVDEFDEPMHQYSLRRPEHEQPYATHSRSISTSYQGTNAWPIPTPASSRITDHQAGLPISRYRAGPQVPIYQAGTSRPYHQTAGTNLEAPPDMPPNATRPAMLQHGQGVYELSTDELEKLIDEVMVERGFEDFCNGIATIITSRETHQEMQYQAQVAQNYPNQYHPRQGMENMGYISQGSAMGVGSESEGVFYRNDTEGRGHGEREDEYPYQNHLRGPADYARGMSETDDRDFERELEGSME